MTYTPARDLQATFFAKYLKDGTLIKGSLLERVVTARQEPLHLIFNQQKFTCSNIDSEEQNDGMIDSLRYLVHHVEYNKPWSEEDILATLLTKAF